MRETDPRVLRTKKMFRKALIKLIEQKGYDSITIKDIAEEAELRRATFYLHYKDKDELLLSILDQALGQLEDLIKESPDHFMTLQGEIELNLRIFTYIERYHDFYQAVLDSKAYAYITERMCRYQENVSLIKAGDQVDNIDKNMVGIIAAYITGAKIQIIRWWLKNGMQPPKEKMAEITSRTLVYGLAGKLEFSDHEK